MKLSALFSNNVGDGCGIKHDDGLGIGTQDVANEGMGAISRDEGFLDTPAR